MHDQTYGTGLERDHPFRDIGLATKQAQNVAERMEMITAATKTAQKCARRARGTTCSAQIGTASSGQIGTVYSAQ